MYYYGNNGYYGGVCGGGYGANPYSGGCAPTCFSGYTNSGVGAAIWIVLFILLVIIIGAGWNWNNN